MTHHVGGVAGDGELDETKGAQLVPASSWVIDGHVCFWLGERVQFVATPSRHHKVRAWCCRVFKRKMLQ